MKFKLYFVISTGKSHKRKSYFEILTNYYDGTDRAHDEHEGDERGDGGADAA